MQRTKNPFDPARPVRVYWNLHRNLYSVQQRGLVVGHAENIELRDVTFKVSEAGRQRVLKESRKNVHAFVTGYLYEGKEERNYDTSIVYNPYKYDSFRLRYNDRVTVLTADFVSLNFNTSGASIHADSVVLSYVPLYSA